MGSSERQLVADVFDSNWIAPMGAMVDCFEQSIQDFTTAKHAAVLSSGTAAIHLALIMLGVERDDYVICQSFTFSASANPIRYLGANPVFVDSETDTWNMCPRELEKAVESCIKGGKDSRGNTLSGKKPKAIIPVHLYGMPARMDDIMAVAARYGIPVIEDAAEALGSRIGGRMCGSIGDMNILSFNGNKIITTSGGGALLSDNAEWINKARFLATQARDPAPHYEHSEVGYNYRMSNVLAGIGCGQMRVLEERVRQRRGNFDFYFGLLGMMEGISFVSEPEGFFSNRWLTTILVDPDKTGGVTRESIRLALENENIESRPLWKPMHMQPVYESFPYFGNNASGELFERGLCLPSGSAMDDGDRSRIAGVLSKILADAMKTVNNEK